MHRLWTLPLAATLSLATLLPAAALSLTDPRTGLSRSVAVADEPQALLVNPAGLGYRDEFQTLVSKGWDSAGAGVAALNFGGLAFAFEQGTEAGSDWQRGSLGLGTRLLPGLLLGAAGRAGNAGGNFTSLDLGLLWRPSDYFSLGFAARDLTNPRLLGVAQSRSYQAGVALRPGTDRLTLAVDLGYREGDPFTALVPRFELLASPLSGVNLRGAIDTRGQAEVALSLGWAHGTVGHAQGFGGAQPVSYAAYHSGYERPVWVGDRSRVADLDLRGPIVAEVSRGLFGASSGRALADVLLALKQAKEQPDVGGVVLRLGGTQAGWATFDEIRQSLDELRQSGKKVIVYLYGVDTPEYYLASVADLVVIHPLGELAMRGVSMQVAYYKGLLDKLGVEADFVRIGEYKSAVEPMTLDSMSPANRRQLEAILDDQYERLVRTVAQSRHLEPAKVKSLVDIGHFTAAAAKTAGLVDDVLYEDALLKRAGELFGKENPSVVKLEAIVPRRTAWQDPDRIAIIAANGAITEGRSGRNLLTGESALGADTMVKAIRMAAQDIQVRAVVLRIDSPGGSVIASDMIWRELVKLKEAGKPLVISMGDVAGSGGYWIATPADRIIADPGTITGSIGVLAGKMSLGGLYAKLGVRQEVLKRGARADEDSDGRRFTDEERAAMQASIESTYHVFLDRVAASRGLTRDEVDARGRGRVYTGAQAKGLKLVDDLGGMMTAVELARTMAKLSKDKVEIVQYPDPEAVLTTLLDNELSVSLKPMLLERLMKSQVLVLMPEALGIGSP